MSKRDVLEVVARTTGLLMMVYWVFALGTALYLTSVWMTFNAFLMFAIGGYLLKGAPKLLDWGFTPILSRAERRERLGRQ